MVRIEKLIGSQRKKKFVISIFLVLHSIHSAIATEIPTVTITPVADWVESVKFNDAEVTDKSAIIGGEHYLLYDRQVNLLATRAAYRHIAVQLVNETAVAENSRINVNFAPSYQTLDFHDVVIWRDGKALPQSIQNKIQLLQREKELENLIYDGSWTATLLLDDIRKNDILEYSYTLTGQNPIFVSHVNEGVYLEWSIPIQTQTYRLLLPKDTPITITAEKSVKKELTLTPFDNFKEYRIERSQFPSLQVDSEAPSWFDPYDKIYFSSIFKWQQTVDWAMPFYKVNDKTNPEIELITSQIRTSYKTKLEQASAALRYVQDEIRYVAVEVGSGGFIPNDVNTTLSRRYGDCKDKTFLLLTLLKSLDIPAFPVLANSKNGERLNDFGPRLNAFTHVLVQAVIDRTEYWLEATTNNQASTLDKIFQPDYGLALVLKAGTQSLTPMFKIQPYHKKIINETFNLTSGVDADAIYSIETNHIGAIAEKFRRDLNSSGKNKLEKVYLDYFTKFYPKIESTETISITDDKILNTVAVTEQYKIPAFWYNDDDNSRLYASFFGYELYPHLTKPTVHIRNSPYGLHYPINIEQNITVALTGDWEFENEIDTVNTDFFNFSREISFEAKENKLQINYKFNTLKKYINADETKEYLNAIEQVKNLIEFGIFINNAAMSDAVWLTERTLFLLILLTFAVLLLYSLIEFIHNQKKTPETNNVKYYPVSTVKFFIVSLATFNLYFIYWFYKNWSYVKKREHSHIIPWGRALLWSFWYYPFYTSLKRDEGFSNSIFSRWKNVRYALLAIAVVIFVILSNRDVMISYVAMVIVTACVIPLVELINSLTPTTNENYIFNSRWRARHVIFISLFLLVSSVDISQQIGFIPKEDVVDGRKLWTGDIQYLHRIGVLSPDEELLLFYTSSLWSLKDSGNGLTSKGVFSYWRDDSSNELTIRMTHFSGIQDIEHSTFRDNSSSIKIVNSDGSHFLLIVKNSARHNFYSELKRKWDYNVSTRFQF